MRREIEQKNNIKSPPNRGAFLDLLMMRIKNYDIYFFSTIIVIILGIIIRTKLLILNPSHWYDSYALALNLENSYSNLFKPLYYSQVAPPFFLVINKFIYNIFYTGGSIEFKDFIIRLFPYFCSILSLPIFALCVQKIFKSSIITLVATFLLSFNTWAINYAIEFKQYSCELMFSCILLYLFYSIDLKNDSYKKISIYSLLLVISPWFAHTSWLIIFTGILYLLISYIKTKEISIKKFLIILLPTLINLLIFYTKFYIPINTQLYSTMNNYWGKILVSFFNFNNFLNLFPERVNDLIPIIFNINFWFFWFINTLFLFFSENKKNIYFILTPIILTILASFMKLYPFQNRLILFLLPFFIILAVQFILMIPKKNKKLFGFITLIIISFFCVNFYKKPIENYIIHKSISRDLFYLLKEKNPTLKNIVSDNVIFPYLSNGKFSNKDCCFIPFEYSKIHKIINTTSNSKYWLFIPFGDKYYIEEAQLFLSKNKKIKSIKYYTLQHKNKYVVGTEKQAFIAEIEI